MKRILLFILTNLAVVLVLTVVLKLFGLDRALATQGLGYGDMVTLTLIQGVVNTFVVFLSRVVGALVDRTVFRTERGTGPGYFITVIVCQIVFGILASLIVAWFSRQREFRADAGSARLL